MTDAVPRVHAEFPAGYTAGRRWSLSDVRCEQGNWSGQQRASWFLETADGTNPADNAGSLQQCPTELMVTWERNKSAGYSDDDNNGTLTLINTEDSSDLLLWRRFPNIGVWAGQDGPPENYWQFWSPGWLDAAEGHIVMTRNTAPYVEDTASPEYSGEVWLFSLRWDRVLIFTISAGIRSLLSYSDISGRVLRESGTWGARRYAVPKAVPITNYDKSFLPTADFAGTLRKEGSESLVSGLTYDCKIKQGDDGLMYVAYGIQQVPNAGTLGADSPAFAGVIRLGEDPSTRDKTRWLFQKSTGGFYPLWSRSESWVGIGLSTGRVLYWMQHRSDGQFDEKAGVLCRKDFSGSIGDNLSTAPITETNSWQGGGAFVGNSVHMSCVDSSPLGGEVVTLVTGSDISSLAHLFVYDAGAPASSQFLSIGANNDGEPVTYSMTKAMPMVEFPRWYVYALKGGEYSTSEVRTGFTTRSKDEGKPSFRALSTSVARGTPSIGGTSLLGSGNWLTHAKVLGLVANPSPGQPTHVHKIARGKAIEAGDFTIELQGLLYPAFRAGDCFNALESAPPTQIIMIGLQLVGDKDTKFTLGFEFKGNDTATGGVFYRVGAEFATSTGATSVKNSVVSGLNSNIPGYVIRLRLKRQSTDVLYQVYDQVQGSFLTIYTQEECPQLPLMPVIIQEVYDDLGLDFSLGVEWSSMILAPADDPVGSVHFRPSDRQGMIQTLASVSGCVANRAALPTLTSGDVVVSDAWVNSNKPSRP